MSLALAVLAGVAQTLLMAWIFGRHEQHHSQLREHV